MLFPQQPARAVRQDILLVFVIVAAGANHLIIIMSVLALAIVNNRNTPVLVRTRDEESLDMLFKLHSSLDVIEEKLNTRDQYLGILSQSDSHKIYGLCSLTHTKVLLMVNNNVIKDNEARSILRTIHNTYVDVTSNNPFYTYGHEVKSKYAFWVSNS